MKLVTRERIGREGVTADNDRLRTQFPIYNVLYAYYKSRVEKKT